MKTSRLFKKVAIYVTFFDIMDYISYEGVFNLSKILLNGLHYESHGAGISKYTNMLLKTFIEENYDVDILIRDEFKHELFSNNLIFTNQTINGSKDRIIYEQLKAQKLYKNYKLVHFPDYATPALYKGKKVATIHDMAMHTMRDKYTVMQNITKNILIKNTIHSAEKLICDSEFSKRELLNYYPKAEDKVEVIYGGIDIPEININPDEEAKVLQRFNIVKNKYILYVGTIAPHKNIKKLIQAFSYIKNKIPEYKLVIAGKKGWMYNEVFEEVERLNLQNEIIFTDFVSDIDLEVLYKNAELFVSVSLYEGFGFPPLEAMGRNIPVLISDIEIFRETCLDCAIYCNPNEIEDIGDKIIQILNDKELQKDLTQKARERVKFFDWKKTAEETYNLYLHILN